MYIWVLGLIESAAAERQDVMRTIMLSSLIVAHSVLVSITVFAVSPMNAETTELKSVPAEGYVHVDRHVSFVSRGPVGEDQISLRVILSRVEIFNEAIVEILRWDQRGFPNIDARYKLDRKIFNQHLGLAQGYLLSVSWIDPKIFEIETTRGTVRFQSLGDGKFMIDVPGLDDRPHN